MSSMIMAYLTCADQAEADKISRALLEAKLIACARRLPVESMYWWEGKIEQASEQMLVMETVAEKFDAISKLVNTLHSYDTPALTATAVAHTTPAVEAWLAENLAS